jgi:hypothetical protein
MKTQFHNTAEDSAPEFTGFSNELSVNADGWAQLAPYGDFPGRAVIANADGTVTGFDAVQRLDRAAADNMVRNFYSLGNRVRRFFKSCAIFSGHPDMPGAGDRYPDRAPKGVIADLHARDTGLFCRPLFNQEGEAMLNLPGKLFLSGRWISSELPGENGRRVFRPDELKSAGLTPTPNLPVQHLNDQDSQRATAGDSTAAAPPANPLNREALLQLLAAHGVQFTNDAADQQVLDALTRTLADLAAQRDAANAGLASARADFAGERKARIGLLLDDALTAGRITAAQRPDWERRLGDDAVFANESAALSRLPRIVKTASVLEGAGLRKLEIANAAQRCDAVQTLVRAEMDRARCDYPTAFARVREANPALFAEMKQPQAGFSHLGGS